MNKNQKIIKIRLSTFFLILAILVIVVIALFMYKLYNNPKDTSNNVEIPIENTSALSENTNTYQYITDLTKLSDEKNYFAKLYNNDKGKILKRNGTFEGLFNVNGFVYKIKINTNNFLMPFGLAEYACAFKILDNSNYDLHDLCFEVVLNKLPNDNIEKKNIYIDNNWRAFISQDGYLGIYYTFNKTEDAYAFIGLSDDNLLTFSEEECMKLYKNIINCFTIEFDNNSQLNQCQNMVFSTNSDYKLDDNIMLKFDKIKSQILYQNNYAENDTIFELNNNEYTFSLNYQEIFDENFNNYIENWKNVNTTEYSNCTDFTYKNYKFYFLYYKENDIFSSMIFEVNGIIYYISLSNFEKNGVTCNIYDNKEQLNYKYFINYLLNDFIIIK